MRKIYFFLIGPTQCLHDWHASNQKEYRMTDNPIDVHTKDLPIKQATFIRYYTDPTSESFGNASKSYVRAGYSPNGSNTSASQTLAKPKIKAIVKAIKDDLEGLSNLSFDIWLKDGITAYKRLDDRASNKHAFWQSVGKARGWLGADNQINAMLISSDDLNKIRESVAKRLSDGIAPAIDTHNERKPSNNNDLHTDNNNDTVVEGGGVYRVGEPPADPVYKCSTPLQSAHNFTLHTDKSDVSVSESIGCENYSEAGKSEEGGKGE